MDGTGIDGAACLLNDFCDPDVAVDASVLPPLPALPNEEGPRLWLLPLVETVAVLRAMLLACLELIDAPDVAVAVVAVAVVVVVVVVVVPVAVAVDTSTDGAVAVGPAETSGLCDLVLDLGLELRVMLVVWSAACGADGLRRPNMVPVTTPSCCCCCCCWR